jgi:hypothetical protein
MITDKKADTLVLLISNANILKESDLEESIQAASKMGIPLERAIIMSGRTTSAALELPVRATKMVEKGKLTIDQAIAAVRLVSHQKMSIEEAVAAVKAFEANKKSRPNAAITSEVGQLLLAADIINSEQLEQATQRAQQAAIPVGRMLRVNNAITSLMLNSAINGHMLLRDNKATREQIVDALKAAHRKKASIEQALFEAGTYQQPGDNELKLSDLFSMANLIAESDRLECLELEVIHQRPLGQILLDQGLVTQDLMETAIHLQGAVATDAVRAYQAAEALRRVANEKISVYQALGELKRGIFGPPFRLGDLLVACEFATTQQIEAALQQSADTNIKVGKVLLKAGVISEQKLFISLRCQSLVKFGFVSDPQAIAALRQADRLGSLEDAFNGLGVYAPSSMQWSWV